MTLRSFFFRNKNNIRADRYIIGRQNVDDEYYFVSIDFLPATRISSFHVVILSHITSGRINLVMILNISKFNKC